MYYVNICENNNLSKSKLQERIKNHEYMRISNATKIRIINEKQLNLNDLIPNIIIIKTKLLKAGLFEYELKQSMLNNFDDFLIQLSMGFAYVDNEFSIKYDSRYNYIDLLIYNIKYK